MRLINRPSKKANYIRSIEILGNNGHERENSKDGDHDGEGDSNVKPFQGFVVSLNSTVDYMLTGKLFPMGTNIEEKEFMKQVKCQKSSDMIRHKGSENFGVVGDDQYGFCTYTRA